MSVIERKIIFTGARSTFTGKINGYWQVKDGVCVLRGALADVEGETTFLGKMYAAYPEGDSRLKGEADGAVRVQAHGTGGASSDVHGGNEQGDGTPASQAANLGSGAASAATGDEGSGAQGDGLREALSKLDPRNDDHWNADGQPKVAAVERFLERPTSREAIREIAPDLKRGG